MNRLYGLRLPLVLSVSMGRRVRVSSNYIRAYRSFFGEPRHPTIPRYSNGVFRRLPRGPKRSFIAWEGVGGLGVSRVGDPQGWRGTRHTDHRHSRLLIHSFRLQGVPRREQSERWGFTHEMSIMREAHAAGVPHRPAAQLYLFESR